MNFRISTLAAGAALLLAPSFAQAQDSVVVSPQFGTPAHASDARNVQGGGEARLVGSGEDARVVYTGPVRGQAPLYAHMVGTGEDARIVYSVTPDRNLALRGAGEIPGSQAQLERALPRGGSRG